MAVILCPMCGSENTADANFCSVCGHEFVEAEHEHTASHPVVEVHHEGDVPIVVITTGNKAGSRFAVNAGVTTIGRHPQSDVFLDDVTVSRRHSAIRAEDGRLIVSDEGSLNGTYLNGERIEQAELHEGDRLQVGKFKLVLVFGASGGVS
jgi:hypothetical protein